MLASLYVVITVASMSYGGFYIESVSSWSTDLATLEACQKAGARVLEQKTQFRYETRTAHCIDKQTGELVTLEKPVAAK